MKKNALGVQSSREDRLTRRGKREATSDDRFLTLIYEICWGQAAVVLSDICSQDKD